MQRASHTAWTSESAVLRAPAPPTMTWSERRNALFAGIRDDILLQVIGCDRDFPELWDGYNDSLEAFSHAYKALVKLLPRDTSATPEILARLVARDAEAADIDVDADELEYLVSAGQRNMLRMAKGMERLQRAGLEAKFAETEEGGRLFSSMWGLVLRPGREPPVIWDRGETRGALTSRLWTVLFDDGAEPLLIGGEPGPGAAPSRAAPARD